MCDKVYSSASSLCNHNKKFHNVCVIQRNNYVITSNKNVISNNENTIPNNTNVIPNNKVNNEYICCYCKKPFKMRQYRWKHQQTCKQNVNNNKTAKKLEEMEKTINELKMELELNKHYCNNITNNTNITNNNNGTIINNIVKFGEISYDAIFSDKQIRQILNHKHKALEEGIKQTHFNKNHPEFNNIFITNMRDNLAHIYDGNT